MQKSVNQIDPTKNLILKKRHLIERFVVRLKKGHNWIELELVSKILSFP